MVMSSRAAFGKVKAILLIDIIILSLAAGIYLYFQASGQLDTEPVGAEYFFSDLEIVPVEADVGEPILISANVSNIGDLAANYTVSLFIDDLIVENQTIRLVSGVSSIVEFVHNEFSEGNFTAQLGNLTDTFSVKAFFPEDSAIKLSSLIINLNKVDFPEPFWPTSPTFSPL